MWLNLGRAFSSLKASRNVPRAESNPPKTSKRSKPRPVQSEQATDLGRTASTRTDLSGPTLIPINSIRSNASLRPIITAAETLPNATLSNTEPQTESKTAQPQSNPLEIRESLSPEPLALEPAQPIVSEHTGSETTPPAPPPSAVTIEPPRPLKRPSLDNSSDTVRQESGQRTSTGFKRPPRGRKAAASLTYEGAAPRNAR